MELINESEVLEDYLVALPEVDFSNSEIIAKGVELFSEVENEIQKVKIAFEFVRDQILHSWDIKGTIVTCIASDVLKYQEGICYAKSNLLAALLRLEGIPTGFCYQRLTLLDTPAQGYCIHALNAVYLKKFKRWIRLDARGNKEGIDAQFSLDMEKLAFSIREDYDEIDYPIVYVKPNAETIRVLRKNTDVKEMYLNKLPEYI